MTPQEHNRLAQLCRDLAADCPNARARRFAASACYWVGVAWVAKPDSLLRDGALMFARHDLEACWRALEDETPKTCVMIGSNDAN